MRFIDDIFFIWNHGEKRLEQFIQKLNKFHPNIKFTHESSKEDVSFLDVIVKKSDGNLITDLYIKPTDRHQYLHYTSSHPDHIKRSIIYSQCLRVRRVCNKDEDYRHHLDNMKSWFCKMGYPNNLVEEQVSKVKSGSQKSNNKDNVKGVPLVLTYNPVLKSAGNILKKYLNILHLDEEVKKYFHRDP